MSKSLSTINNELKDYLNESKFVSNKCRNKIIKELINSLELDIDKDDYYEFANVDMNFNDEFNFFIRGKEYKTNISSLEELNEKYIIFKDKADNIMSHNELSFDKTNNFAQIFNLVMIGGICLVYILLILFAIQLFLSGNISTGLWLLVFIFPIFIPKLKDNLSIRFEQAKTYIKRLLKKKK